MDTAFYDHIDSAISLIFAFSCLVMLPLAYQFFMFMRSRVKEANGYRYVRPYPVISLALFVGSILTIACLSFVLKSEARKEIDDYFTHLDMGTASVTINGAPVADSAAVLNALRTPQHIWAHHSYPINRIYILIHGKNGDLSLRLGRDSQERREYCVFYPRYDITSHNEAYRINSKLFDSY